MPLRDLQGRFCGTLHRKEVDGHWDRYYFVLDEDKCLLRYFSLINAQEEYLDWEDYEGEINIRLITKIEDKSKTEDKSKYDEYIEIQTCNERFCVRADTREGTQEWIRTLRNAAVNPSKRTEDSMVSEDKLANHSTEADKDSTLEQPERVCYETKIIGGAVVRIPVRKVNSSKRTEDSMVSEDKLANHSTEADKDSTLEQPERVCYETKIIGGAVVRTPVRKMTDSDSDGGSYSSDSLIRSGSAGTTSTIKPIKEGYLTKKGALVRNWKKRYFKLDSLRLAYYEKDSDKEPLKVIFTSDITAVKPNLSVDSTRKHLFEVVTQPRTFFIQGETEEEMQSWIQAIASVSPRGRCSSEPDSKRSQELLKADFQFAETTTL